MEKLRAGVAGVGHLGKFHAEKYALLENVELVGLFDPDEEKARKIAGKFRCRPMDSLEDLLRASDLISVAAPTGLHVEIAERALSSGVHCLVEKPLAEDAEGARRLLDLAKREGLKLQVGQLERFNPAFVKLCEKLDRPLYVESSRLTPYLERAVAVDVCRDLIIHDLDLTLDLAKSPLESFDAKGVKVFSETVDLATLHLRFANGCVADLKAGRLSPVPVRQMRVFQPSAYFSLDFREQSLRTIDRESARQGGAKGWREHAFKPERKADVILLEIESFVKTVRENGEVEVGAEGSVEALEIITDSLNRMLEP